jgi:NAD(P)-dependent dehydrogenase (short-subunit alcohol dehydrogenase family)
MARSTRANRFDGKVVIVTGAAHGIGQGVAAAFAHEGARVYGMDVDAASLGASEQALVAAGNRFTGIIADVSVPTDITRSIERIQSEAGRIDVLVNNAGINMGKRIAELELSDWERVFNTNLRSAYLMSRAAWTALQAVGSGNIVNMGSVMGQVGQGCPDHAFTLPRQGRCSLRHSSQLHLPRLHRHADHGSRA